MINKVLLVFLIAFTFIACEQSTASKEVLFVCTHGAARSPIAAAYFNKLAKENGLNYHAVFKGTEPNKELTYETNSGLTKDGFNISGWLPEKVSAQDVEQAFKIVTFDCSVPSGKKNEEWNGTPSISEDYIVARNIIKKNVEQLIESLK